MRQQSGNSLVPQDADFQDSIEHLATAVVLPHLGGAQCFHGGCVSRSLGLVQMVYTE